MNENVDVIINLNSIRISGVSIGIIINRSCNMVCCAIFSIPFPSVYNYFTSDCVEKKEKHELHSDINSIGDVDSSM